MRKYITILLIFFCPLCVHSQDKSLIIRSVTVIDMVNERVQPNMTVVIKGNKITSISKKAKTPKNATVIDAKGKYLIPGLWDMHVHIRETEPISFPLFIANGVTGIREMHYPGKCTSIGQWKDSLSSVDGFAPRIGAVAGCTVDGPGDNRGFGSTIVSSEEQARQEVRNLKKSGADFVKVYNFLPLSTYQAIVDEAKKQGIPLAGHIPYSVPAITCSQLGQKSFEHMGDLHRYFSSEETTIVQAYTDSLAGLTPAWRRHLLTKAYETYTPKKASALAQVLKKNGTYLCPTLITSQIVSKRSYLSQEGKERLKVIPASINQKWAPKTVPQRSAKDSLFSTKLIERELEIIKLLHQAGVSMMAGSDASPLRYVVPDYSLHDELQLLVGAGFTPYEALKTATINPASFLNRSHELGTIAEGKLADLVLLEANPLEDISHTQKIAAVIVNSRLLQRSDLDSMLRQANEMASKK